MNVWMVLLAGTRLHSIYNAIAISILVGLMIVYV